MTGRDGRMARVAERLRMTGVGERAVAVSLAILLVVALGGLVAVAQDSTRADTVSAPSTPDLSADAESTVIAIPDSLQAALEKSEDIVTSTAPVRRVLEELVIGTDVMWVDTLPCSTERGYMLPERGNVAWCVGQATGQVYVTDAGTLQPWAAMALGDRRDWLRVAYSIRESMDAEPVSDRDSTVMSRTATARDVLTEFVVGPDVQWVDIPCSDGRGDLLPDSGPAGCVGTAGQPALTWNGADVPWVDLAPADRAVWLAAGYELRDLLIASVSQIAPNYLSTQESHRVHQCSVRLAF